MIHVLDHMISVIHVLDHVIFTIIYIYFSCDPYRSEVCTLLLCHGADPTLTNCHSKSALDLAASPDLQAKIECKLIG